MEKPWLKNGYTNCWHTIITLSEVRGVTIHKLVCLYRCGSSTKNIPWESLKRVSLKRRRWKSWQTIIQPTIGILTNIGEAHAEGFSSLKEKLQEKLKLFAATELFIYSPEYTQGIPEKELPGERKFSWSTRQDADLKITFIEPIEDRTYIRAVFNQREIECLLPFRDQASVENGIICWATLACFGLFSRNRRSAPRKVVTHQHAPGIENTASINVPLSTIPTVLISLRWP